MRVLLTYSTKHGATGGIVRQIALALRDRGLQVDVKRMYDIPTLDPYDAVVVGSAIYMGRWMKEAVNFLADNVDVLATKMVWLFSSGPTGEGDAVELMDGWTLPNNVQKSAEQIRPRGIKALHGALDMNLLNMIERIMVRQVGAKVGDYRDWDEIEAWGNEIADVLVGTVDNIDLDDPKKAYRLSIV